MRILFDQGTPLPLRNFLWHHDIQTAFRMGWAELNNGDLIAACEPKFNLLITTDKNLKYQQNLKNRRLAILVLPTTNWPEIKLIAESVVNAVDQIQPGDYVEL